MVVSTAATAQDRRRSPRATFQQTVGVRVKDWASLTVMGHDISCGGIRLSLPRFVEAGAQVTVSLTLPNEMLLRIEAEVRHVSLESTEGACVAGLRWLDTGSTEIDVLKTLVADLQSGKAP